MLSAVHGTSAALRSGKTSFGKLANASIFSKEHFPKFLGSGMLFSGWCGWQFMGFIHSYDPNLLVHTE